MSKYIYNPDDPNPQSSNYVEDTSNVIDVKEVIVNIWRKRKYIFIFTSCFLLLGLFVALTSPALYISKCTVVPQLGDQKTGGLGGIASMMGVNIGSSNSGETLSPKVYPQIINSVPFCKEIMLTPIVITKSHGDTITLYDYYTNRKYQPTDAMGSIKRYTIGLPGLLISSFRSGDASTVYSDIDTGGVITLTNKERFVIANIKDKIYFNSNPKDGYITLGYSFSEPQATAVIAQNVYATLEKYVANYKSLKQQDNLSFIQKNYDEAREDFMEKQDALAAFQDANRDLTSAMARTTERSLSSEYEIAYTVYNELARQLEQAKISVKESTPILTIVDPVVVPNKKSGTSKIVIMIGFIMIGLVLSTLWVLIKPLFKDFVSEIKEEDNSEE